MFPASHSVPGQNFYFFLSSPEHDQNRVSGDDSFLYRMSKSGILRITLDYTIRRTNRRTNMVYPFYLHEGTDLVGVIG